MHGLIYQLAGFFYPHGSHCLICCLLDDWSLSPISDMYLANLVEFSQRSPVKEA